MKSLLGMALAFASAAWATPLAFTGSSDVSCCLYQTFLNIFNEPENAFRFAYSAEGGPTTYNFCTDWASNGCDLSYRFVTFYGPDISLFASDGKTTVSNSQGLPGPHWDGQLTWTAKPIHFSSVPETGVNLFFPVIISGYLKVWTNEAWLEHKAPFFDYSVTGTGTLRTWIIADDPSFIAFQSAHVEFEGQATQTPEPVTTWIFALSPLLAPLYRRVRDR